MRNLSRSQQGTIIPPRKVASHTLALTGLLLATLVPALPAPPAFAGSIPAYAAPRIDDDSASAEAVTKSKLLPITLPTGAWRSKNEADIAKFAEALRKVAQANKRDIGMTEVLIWQTGKDAKAALPRSLKALGYGYTTEEPVKLDEDKLTLFACKAPEGKASVLGMWVDHGDSAILAWTTVTGEKAATENGSGEGKSPATAAAPEKKEGSAHKPAPEHAGSDAAEPLVLQADASAFTLNVMGRKMPTLPAMPNIAARPGYVRGYVRDTQGHPLKGALIGIRSTAVGGLYSGASAKTDAEGYYEIKAPWGVGSFYCAGYKADYGDLIAAFGLHPTDGETDEFATAKGVVKNWVLLPYGIGDRGKAQDDPKYCGNYYGGTIVFGYYTDSDSKTSLPPNSEIEITLTPTGPLLDGSKGRTIVVHKATGTGLLGQLYLNNIPVGAYKIKARLAGGGALRIRETGPYANAPFGLTPKDARGEADLLLKVYGSDPNSATAGHGHWNTFQISLERP